jgi:hypothetical protein
MGTFTFYDTRTKEYETFTGTIAEAEVFAAANPKKNWLGTAQPIIDPVRLGVTKPSAGFRNLLKTMKKRMGPRSTINDWGGTSEV